MVLADPNRGRSPGFPGTSGPVQVQPASHPEEVAPTLCLLSSVPGEARPILHELAKVAPRDVGKYFLASSRRNSRRGTGRRRRGPGRERRGAGPRRTTNLLEQNYMSAEYSLNSMVFRQN